MICGHTAIDRSDIYIGTADGLPNVFVPRENFYSIPRKYVVRYLGIVNQKFDVAQDGLILAIHAPNGGMLSKMTTTTTYQNLSTQAKALLQRVLGRRDPFYGFGGMSCTVYDTAWVSMVTEMSHGVKQWLFPESFHYIISTQLENGGWEATTSQTDGILNTASSLYSLIKHAREPLQIRQISDDELRERVERAVTALQSQLTEWDVLASSQVGFEVIIPSLLELLENEGYMFEFGDRAELFRLRATKLKYFTPELLYGKSKLSIIHSLESFIGKVDFNKVAHHKVHGSMMASPSSTAAYLMNISTEDNEAKAYLQHVVNASPNRDGGVPSAYPSTYFEYTWVCYCVVLCYLLTNYLFRLSQLS